jgi:hypothetical protein
MAVVSDRAIREGLCDYTDECEDDAAEQARIDAENHEIMEDILACELELEYRISEKSPEELLEMILSKDTRGDIRYLCVRKLKRLIDGWGEY